MSQSCFNTSLFVILIYTTYIEIYTASSNIYCLDSSERPAKSWLFRFRFSNTDQLYLNIKDKVIALQQKIQKVWVIFSPQNSPFHWFQTLFMLILLPVIPGYWIFTQKLEPFSVDRGSFQTTVLSLFICWKQKYSDQYHSILKC